MPIIHSVSMHTIWVFFPLKIKPHSEAEYTVVALLFWKLARLKYSSAYQSFSFQLPCCARRLILITPYYFHWEWRHLWLAADGLKRMNQTYRLYFQVIHQLHTTWCTFSLWPWEKMRQNGQSDLFFDLHYSIWTAQTHDIWTQVDAWESLFF